MPTTREGIVAVFCEILAPLRQGAVRHAQLAGNVRLRFLAGLEQADRFHLKFFCVRLLLFLHGSCSPLWSFLLLVYSLHKGVPWSPCNRRCRREMYAFIAGSCGSASVGFTCFYQAGLAEQGFSV